MSKDRYLLSSQAFVNFFKKDDLELNKFLASVNSEDVFISVVTLGIIRDAINQKSTTERIRFDPYLRDGINAFDSRIIDIDEEIINQWSYIRSLKIKSFESAADSMGEDEKLIIATAIFRGFVFVGHEPSPVDELKELGFISLNPWPETPDNNV